MQTTRFDVIVVGSGASGGWAAKRLSEAGIKVALLEAGKPQGDADFTEHVPAYDLTYRDQASEWMRRTRPRQRDCYACREWNYKWFVNDLEEPYTTPDDKPFSWQGRTRVVGGRTNVWGRQSYRFSDQDLHAQVVRRVRRGLADLLQGSRAVLRARRGLRRDFGTSGERAGAARQPLPSGDADELRGDAAPHAREEQAWLDRDHRTRGQHHAADQRPPCVPLLRALRARVRDALVLQRRLHDGRRRAEIREHDADHRTRWSIGC